MLKAAAGCQPAPLRTAWKQLWCSKAAAQAASPHRLEAALVLKGRCGLPARRIEAALVLTSRCKLQACTAWKQLWFSKAVAGCQPAPLRGSFFGAQGCYGLPARTAWKQFGAQNPLQAASPHRSALLGSSFGAQKLLRAPSTAWKQLWCLKRRYGHTAWKQLWCSKAAAGSQRRRTAWKQLWCSKAAADSTPALIGSFHATRPLRAASPHRSALLGSSFGAQRPLQAASPHRSALLEAALVPCHTRTAWKQL